MGFMNSYKRLEKLCGEILDDDRRISAYIDEMIEKSSQGEYLINGWKDDLKQLKHYRWIRNQIVHDPSCSEENMCEPDDVDWLDDFYIRIMHQMDPLTLYRNAMQLKERKPVAKSNAQTYSVVGQTRSKTKKKKIGCTVFLVIYLMALATLIYLISYYFL